MITILLVGFNLFVFCLDFLHICLRRVDLQFPFTYHRVQFYMNVTLVSENEMVSVLQMYLYYLIFILEKKVVCDKTLGPRVFLTRVFF